MLEKYFGMIREQSEDVFGAHAKKTLSVFSFFSAAAVVLPLLILMLLVAFRLF